MLPQIKPNGPRNSRGSTAVSNIPPNRERPERNLELVAELHDGLDFSNIAGGYGCGGDEVVRVGYVEHVMDFAGVFVVVLVELGWGRYDRDIF